MIQIHTYISSGSFKKIVLAILILFSLHSVGQEFKQGTINRKLLVTRHNLVITDRNLKGPTQVGNGHFAFGFDITGLQTFSPDANTLSDWGWHKFPEPNGQTPAEFKSNHAVFHRTLDDTKYDVNLSWENGATIKNTKPHR